MMLADGAYDGGAWAFVARRLGKAHLLTWPKIIEFGPVHAVAVEVDLAPVCCLDEAMIALGIQRRDPAVWC